MSSWTSPCDGRCRRFTAATTSSRNSGGAFKMAPAAPRWRSRAMSARVARATGPLPVVSSSSVEFVEADEVVIGGYDKIDLEGSACGQSRGEVGAQEWRIAPPSSQHVPLQAWHHTARRGVPSPTRLPPSSKTSARPMSTWTWSPTRKRATSPASSARIRPSGVSR